MLSPFLSIIIPCYNSAKFIADTIEMLLKQDLSDCEVILINDGSSDETLSILKRYESHSNISVIDQTNQGVSVTRNKGLSLARGKYVYFLDSDDTLTEGTLEYFKRILLENLDCRMFTFGYETRINGRRGKSYVFHQFDKKKITGRILTQNFLNKKFCVHICSSIYERDFLLKNHLLFRQGLKIGEDILFLLQTMQEAGRVYCSSRVCFVYQIRDDSAMQGYRSYSEKQYLSHTVLREYLLPLACEDKGLKKYINFFLLFSYVSNLRYYLCSDFKSDKLNRQFIADGNIRYRHNFTGNIPYWIAMKLIMFFPISLILKIWKS